MAREGAQRAWSVLCESSCKLCRVCVVLDISREFVIDCAARRDASPERRCCEGLILKQQRLSGGDG